MMLIWQQPSYQLPARYLHVSYALCTPSGCSDPVATQPNQTIAYIPLAHKMLADYKGLAWVKLTARSSIGPSSTSPPSESVNIGRGIPSQGSVSLSPGSSASASRRQLDSIGNLAASEIILDGFVEPVLGIDTYQVCLGTKPGGADVLACQLICTDAGSECDSVGLPTTGVLSLGPYAALLPDEAALLSKAMNGSGVSIYAKVRACTILQDCQVAISPGVTIDRVQPITGYVADGLVIAEAGGWEQVLYVECVSGESMECTTRKLLGSDAAMNHLIIRQFQPLVLAAPNTESVESLSGHHIGVSWGTVVDGGSGVSHVSLCVASRCITIPPSSGMAVFELLDHKSGDLVTSTICATDYANNKACRSSAGTTVFTNNAAVTNITIREEYLPSCDLFNASWIPAATLAQCDDYSVSMEICSAGSRGCLPGQILSKGKGNVSATLHEPLEPGVRYAARLITSGCNERSSPTVSRTFACDETPAVTVNERRVVLSSANPLAQPGAHNKRPDLVQTSCITLVRTSTYTIHLSSSFAPP